MKAPSDRPRYSLIALVALPAIVGLATHGALTVKAAPADIAICDRLAAHPEDKDKPAEVKGTYAIADADVPAALKACKAAAATADAPRRIQLELGRAYEFNRQNAEAAKAYRKAADAG